MRTAVVRVGVDLAGRLEPARLDEGMSTLRELADAAGAGLIDHDLAAMPPTRREVQLLIVGDDADTLMATAISWCTQAFGPLGGQPVPGVITYVSRGTDDDAHGVLAGFGLTGAITRSPGDDGVDVVEVTLAEADLDRIPESRIHTALESSLNCEVRIVTT